MLLQSNHPAFIDMTTFQRLKFSRFMRLTLLVTSIYHPISATAQSYTLIGESTENVSSLFEDGSSHVAIYRSGLTTEKKLFFNPFFYFEAQEDGKPNVFLSEESDTESTVHVTILVSPSGKVNEIARYLSNLSKQEPSKAHLNGIMPADLLTIELVKFSCVDISSMPRFRTTRVNEVSTTSRITLTTNLLPTNEAKRLRDNIESGNTILRFKIAFSLNARFKGSDDEVGAKLVSFYKTNAMSQLTGSGRAFSVTRTDGDIGTEAMLVTRDQKQDFEATLTRELNLRYNLDNAANAILLENKLQKYFDNIFEEVSLNPDAGNFASQIEKLSDYGFSTDDLKPSEIKKITADVKDFFKSDRESFSSKDIKASASFLGFGGSAGASHTKKDLEALMTDKGWKFTQEGTIRVPSSLSVYVLKKSVISQSADVTIQISKSYRQEVNLGSEITSKTLYLQKENANRQGDLEALRAIVVQNTPIGSICAFAGNPVKLPDGWLLCDGREYNRTEYAKLADVLDSTGWEKSANASLVKIPDLRGVFLRGSNINGGSDIENRLVGSFQIESTKLPNYGFATTFSGNHSHGDGFAYHWQNIFHGTPSQYSSGIATDDKDWQGVAQADAYGKLGPKDRIFQYRPSEGGNHNHSLVGGDAETRPKNKSVHYIIKAQ